MYFHSIKFDHVVVSQSLEVRNFIDDGLYGTGVLLLDGDLLHCIDLASGQVQALVHLAKPAFTWGGGGVKHEWQ